MQAISVTDTRLNLTTLLSKAQQEPVLIRHNQQDMAVMLSATEYQRLARRPSISSTRPRSIDPKLAALLDACD
jgi:PHD/YefM family antitoxin component YafN of YafNO toxin-antitoxin module